MDVHNRIAEALLNINKSDFSPGQDLLDAGKLSKLSNREV